MKSTQDITARDPKRFWCAQSTNPVLEKKLCTQFSLSNGLLGLRGSHEECSAWSDPGFYMADTYSGGPASLLGLHDPDHILTHPDRISAAHINQAQGMTIWTLPNLPFPLGVNLTVNGEPFSFDTTKILSCERLLDMEEATMRRTLVFRNRHNHRTRIESQRFVSMDNPNLACLRYRIIPLDNHESINVQGFIDDAVTNTNGVKLWQEIEHIEQADHRGISCKTAVSNRTVSIAQHSILSHDGNTVTLDLFAITLADQPLSTALVLAKKAVSTGFDDLHKNHRDAYNAIRAQTAITFDENAALIQGFNFSMLHLQMAFSPLAHKTGVPIKGLTGHGYRFLNFWDMDFHLFPYYLFTRPRDARKLLEYRFAQLDEYRKNAQTWGARGAQVPWETNSRGTEETAPWLCLQEREIHISADAAYMFKLYVEATGEREVMHTMGAEFVFETARFYASRITFQTDKNRYELRDIGCPDQYHTFADNNVFISRMAQWNLEYAVTLFTSGNFKSIIDKIALSDDEIQQWKEQAAGLYIIKPDENGIIEEFDGFFNLDPDLNGITETYCKHSQAVKQPDVLATVIAFEHEYPFDIRVKNWHFYNARTLHGSSLSLPGMAYAAARCGLNDEALYNLFRSCRMDLDDVNLDTERGVHLAGMAVAWHTVVQGFGGLGLSDKGLIFKPNLPRQWQYLNFTIYWHFQKVQVKITSDTISLSIGNTIDRSVNININNGDCITLQPGTTTTFNY